jgi:hypothetical protein
VGRNRVLYIRGRSFDGVVTAVGGRAGATFAFCEGVMNGPPLDVVFTGCPLGR